MKHFLYFLFILYIIQVSLGFAKESALNLPSEQQRIEMISNLSHEIQRLDGEGLIPRKNRLDSWEKTLKKLEAEAILAKTLYDFGRVFKKIDATYPNLHAKLFMRPELDERKTEGMVVLPFKFYPEKVDRIFKESKFRLIVPKNNKTDLQTGDELISINSIPLKEWTDENFIFCKFPNREQCEIEFYDNFRKELLGWNRHQPLEIKIRHENQERILLITPEIKPLSFNDEPTNLPCDVSPKRYKGFKLVYE